MNNHGIVVKSQINSQKTSKRRHKKRANNYRSEISEAVVIAWEHMFLKSWRTETGLSNLKTYQKHPKVLTAVLQANEGTP